MYIVKLVMLGIGCTVCNLLGGNCSDGSPGTTIFYLNGIRATEFEAQLDRNTLEDRVRTTLKGTTKSNECLEFKLAYNETGGSAEDLWQSTRLRLSQDLVLFTQYLADIDAAPEWFRDAFNSVSARIDETAEAPEIDSHINDYEAELTSLDAVIVVSHSQGNLYANAEYRKLQQRGWPLPDNNKLSIVSVASPARVVEGDGPWTTLLLDRIHFIPGSLGWTTTNLPQHFDGHGFAKRYLHITVVNNVWNSHSARSLTKIMDHIFSAIPARGTVSVIATLDGNTWPTSGSGAVNYNITCPARSIKGTAVPASTTGIPVGQCTLTHNSGGPPNSMFRGIVPCAIPSATPTTCTQTLGVGQTLSYTLRFTSPPTNQPPTAGFLMTSVPLQPVPNGQTLNVTVPTGGSATVFFDGAFPRSSDADGTVTGWRWTVNGAEVATSTVFSRAFTIGTYSVGLIVTDNLGLQSQAAMGTVIISETGLPSAAYGRWISFREGNPGVPGDYSGVESTWVGSPYNFSLMVPISLGGRPDGLTTTVFLSAYGTQVITGISFTIETSRPQPCKLVFEKSAGLHGGVVVINGVAGSIMKTSQGDLAGWLTLANQSGPGCNFTTADLSITELTVHGTTHTPITVLDAVAIGFGQNAVPIWPTPSDIVTFLFTGVVTLVEDGTNVLNGLIVRGNTVSGTVSYDLNAIDSNKIDMMRGEYAFPNSGDVSITINTLGGSRRMAVGPPGRGVVYNNTRCTDGCSQHFSVGAISGGPGPSIWELPLDLPVQLWITLSTPDNQWGKLLTGDLLPTSLDLSHTSSVSGGWVESKVFYLEFGLTTLIKK